MSSYNKVILVGRVGKDPEIKVFDSGGFIANFSLATSEYWKDKSTGEKKERTEWHRICVKNATLADWVSKNVKKGDLLMLEGQLETRKYQDKQGRDSYTTEIVLRPYSGELKKLIWDKKNEQGQQHDNFADNNAIDDDIPF